MAIIDLVLTNSYNQKIDAVARPYDPMNDILSYFTDWFPVMYNLAGQKLYQDSHWKIADYWEGIAENDRYDIIIIEALDKIQGY